MKYDKSIFESSTIQFEKGISTPKGVIKTYQDLTDIPFLVISGRSNVGKSTFINSFFKNKIARTSKTPGRTQEINLFSFSFRGLQKKFYFFDLPGYGYAKISKEQKKAWNELLSFYFSHMPYNNLLFQLQDSKIPMQNTDEDFLAFLASYDLKTHVIFNKSDKLKNQKEKNNLKKVSENMFSSFPHCQGSFKVSSFKHTGLEDVRKFLYEQFTSIGD
jgi:GTP-binding protein